MSSSPAPSRLLNENSLVQDLHPADLTRTLSTAFHEFLQPAPALHKAVIVTAKHYLDSLASGIATDQDSRKQAYRKRKRKRSEYEADGLGKPLLLTQVYTDGFGIDQIWEQANLVLASAGDEIERELSGLDFQVKKTSGDDVISQTAKGGQKTVRFEDTGSDSEEDRESNPLSEEDILSGFEGPKGLAELDNQIDEIEEDVEDIEGSDASSDVVARPETYVSDPNGLNDGFFSIDDFNKQAQFLEQKDALGEDDNPSDEDEVDWDADPLAVPLPQKSRRNAEESDADDIDSDAGPTFGSVDLAASSDEDQADEDDLEGDLPTFDNTNDISYADFFDPPQQRLTKSKRMRALPKTQPPPTNNDPSHITADIERAIADVRRDLEGSEDEQSDNVSSDGELNSKVVSRSTKANLSTHEKQVAKINSEIRRLEAAAVSKRDWTLSGEALAADRPVNSLIEEDLDFERAGKPVPVITAEVTEEIEALIKRRILNREFDEVVRRHPGAAGDASTMRRGKIDLDDSKPTQGLADIYEAEHLKATDPGYVDKRSVAVKKQHDEISRLWKDVSAKLDVLSNLHFKPKRAEFTVQVLSDKPTISMEDARPGAADGGTESRLAPQEIYVPSDEQRRKGEVLGKDGLARNREEMTREEKLRKRRREKERAKKQESNNAVSAKQPGEKGLPKRVGKQQEKTNILNELRKGGVKVIGKKGNLEEIEGKGRKGKPRTSTIDAPSTAYKL